MAEKDIAQADYTNLDGTVTNYSVKSETTDGAQPSGETYYDNTNWPQYLGYYKNIPELQAAIDAKATWTTCKGYTSNPITMLALSRIRGIGKDNFLNILQNMVISYHIGGDAFAEIIRDSEGNLINLKPLDPGSIRIVANKKGMITRYEQRSKVDKGVVKWNPDNILHLARNRVADEIHGVSIIKAVEKIILARNEAMEDYRKLLHRNVNPIRLWYIDTDDASEVADFKVKADKASTQFENLVVPMNSVKHEIASVPPNSTMNPLPYINQLNQYFFQATGVPQIIVGGAQEITEASAKISYLAFENVIKKEQLFIEEQILGQLNLEINLLFPASLQNELVSDTSKEESMAAATPEDVNVQPEQPQQGATIQNGNLR